MIARLRGTVATLQEEAAVIDVGGVGYLVALAPSTLAGLPAVGTAVELHTELVVREDGMTLYGFLDPADRVWFRLLQTVQGVGARVALSILGVLRPPQLTAAIASGDKAALSRASGVGARLAARILAELRDRVAGLPVSRAVEPGSIGTAVLAPGDDALSALINLGYGRADAYTAVARVRARLGEETPIDRLIRESLKELAP